MRRIALVATVAVVLVACSADRTDFKRETETFLKKSEAVVTEVGVAFTKAECQAPPSTKVGTKYSCVGTAADGTTWDFEVTITAKTAFQVTDYKVRT